MMTYTSACQTGKFETKLFDCFSDCGLCWYVTFCYPCALSKAWAEVRGESCTICHYHAYEIYVKSNLRQIRGMQSDYCRDNRNSSCCKCCSLSQDIRELRIIQKTIQNSGEKANYIDFNENPKDLDSLKETNQNSMLQVNLPLLPNK